VTRKKTFTRYRAQAQSRSARLDRRSRRQSITTVHRQIAKAAERGYDTRPRHLKVAARMARRQS
jgi:hypothetical protein